MTDFDIDVIIDDRIVETEKGADGIVDAHPWVAEARALPSKIGAMVPPLSEAEKFAANHPAFQEGLKERAKLAQLDAIDRTRAKMPKPEDLVAAFPPVVEPEVSYADQLAMSNIYSQLQLGLHSVVADKLEATLNQIARDSYPSPKLAIFREMLPLSRVIEVKKADGQPDYDAMTRLRLVAMRGEDLLRTSRGVILERASEALEIEKYNLETMRRDVEAYGEWNSPKNVTARLAMPKPVASTRRMEAEDRRVRREQKKQDEQTRAQAIAAGMNVLE